MHRGAIDSTFYVRLAHMCCLAALIRFLCLRAGVHVAWWRGLSMAFALSGHCLAEPACCQGGDWHHTQCFACCSAVMRAAVVPAARRQCAFVQPLTCDT